MLRNAFGFAVIALIGLAGMYSYSAFMCNGGPIPEGLMVAGTGFVSTMLGMAVMRVKDSLKPSEEKEAE